LYIDSHLHLNYNAITNKNIIEYLDRNNIEKAWLLTWDEAEYPEKKWAVQNFKIEDIYEVYSRNSERIIPFYAPDPLKTDALTIFKKWESRGIKGFGELKSTIRWSDKKLNEILDYLNERKMPLVFHIENCGHKIIEFNKISFCGKALNIILHSKFITSVSEYVFHSLRAFIDFNKISGIYRFPGYMLDLIEFEERLKKYSDIKFIGHGPHFWANISDNCLYKKYPDSSEMNFGKTIELLRNYKNLYCDLSGFSSYNAFNRNTNFIKKFVEEFYNRLLYGSDNFNFNILKKIEDLGLDNTEWILKKITRENSLNIFN